MSFWMSVVKFICYLFMSLTITAHTQIT